MAFGNADLYLVPVSNTIAPTVGVVVVVDHVIPSLFHFSCPEIGFIG